MRISIIAAVARNGVIGADNELPWRLPADLRHFKAQTLGHTLLMGRRTWEGAASALPGRRTIVLSSSQLSLPDGVPQVSSLGDGIELARSAAETELFIAGGRGVFEAGFLVADRMVLTLIDADFEGDTFFPSYPQEAWREVERHEHSAEDGNPYGFSIVTYERVVA